MKEDPEPNLMVGSGSYSAPLTVMNEGRHGYRSIKVSGRPSFRDDAGAVMG